MHTLCNLVSKYSLASYLSLSSLFLFFLFYVFVFTWVWLSCLSSCIIMSLIMRHLAILYLGAAFSGQFSSYLILLFLQYIVLNLYFMDFPIVQAVLSLSSSCCVDTKHQAPLNCICVWAASSFSGGSSGITSVCQHTRLRTLDSGPHVCTSYSSVLS